MKHGLLLLLTCFTISFLAQAQDFYGIIVADIEDENIGTYCNLDVDLMQTEFAQMAAAIGDETPDIQVLTCNDFNHSTVKRALGGLESQTDDVVFFYFSGHGKANNTNEQQMKIGNSYLDVHFVEESLNGQAARLKFLLTDRCNKVLENESAAPQSSFLPLAPKRKAGSRYAKLLKEYEGTLIAHSSHFKEESYSDEAGGIFTRMFLYTLRQYTKEDALIPVSWQKVLSDAAEETETYVYEFFFKRTQRPVIENHAHIISPNHAAPGFSPDFLKKKQ